MAVRPAVSSRQSVNSGRREAAGRLQENDDDDIVVLDQSQQLTKKTTIAPKLPSPPVLSPTSPASALVPAPPPAPATPATAPAPAPPATAPAPASLPPPTAPAPALPQEVDMPDEKDEFVFVEFMSEKCNEERWSSLDVRIPGQVGNNFSLPDHIFHKLASEQHSEVMLRKRPFNL